MEIRSRIVGIFETLLKPRTIFTFAFFGVTCKLLLEGKEIPEILYSIDLMLLGFYFGEKVAKIKQTMNGGQPK